MLSAAARFGARPALQRQAAALRAPALFSRPASAAAQSFRLGTGTRLLSGAASVRGAAGDAPRRSAAGVAGKALLAVGLAAAAGGAYAVNTSEGVARSVYYWRRAFPIYLHYRYVMWKYEGRPEEELDAAYEVLHNKYAQDAIDIVLHLRGFYIKLAQMGATRPDFIAPQYVEECEKLQDHVPAEPIARVKQIISDSLGRDCDDIFSEIEPEPIGSASIGQVHLARLRSTGQRVAVKVQYPNSEEEFHYDIATIIDFANLAQPAHVPLLREVKKMFATEFDYRGEARNLREIHDNMLPLFEDEVDVPEPIDELCSKHVLTMTYLPGVKLVDSIRERYRRIAEAKGQTLEQMEAEQKAADEAAIAAGRDPEPGPSAEEIRRYTRLLRARDALSNAWIRAYNATMAGLLGAHPLPLADSPAPLNTPDLLSRLFRVHAHQVLVDGVFSSDPHPGNLLHLPDGRIGLIDFGQVKRISKQERHTLARLIIALADEDPEAIVRIYSGEMGLRTRDMNPWVLEKMAVLFFDRCDRKTTDGYNFQLFMEHLDAIDPVTNMPDEYVMPGRVSILLRGLALALRQEVSMAKEWRGVAERVLREDL